MTNQYYLGQEVLVDPGTQHCQDGRVVEKWTSREAVTWYSVEDAIGRWWNAPSDHLLSREEWKGQKEIS